MSKNAAMAGTGARRSSALLVVGAPPVPVMTLLAAAPSRQPMFSHTPDRSGLPSRNVGAGAARFTDPSGSLGTSVRLKRGHCAPSGTVNVMTSATPTPARVLAFIIEVNIHQRYL